MMDIQEIEQVLLPLEDLGLMADRELETQLNYITQNGDVLITVADNGEGIEVQIGQEGKMFSYEDFEYNLDIILACMFQSVDGVDRGVTLDEAGGQG
jgi:hypothetical protein